MNAHELAVSIIKEVMTDDELSSCSTFDELHDYCDANCLGLTEQAFEDQGMEVVYQAQQIVDDFLKRIHESKVRAAERRAAAAE